MMSAKRTQRTSRTKSSAKRDLFTELMEGVRAMKAHRAGKIALRTHSVKPGPRPAL